MALATVGGVATAVFATVNAAADTLTVLLLVVEMLGLAMAVVVVLATVGLVDAVEVLATLVCEVLLTVDTLTMAAPQADLALFVLDLCRKLHAKHGIYSVAGK